MKVQLKVAGMLAALFAIATVVLMHAPKVKAAANGKITGTVKLDGTPPHMKGIDMSKDPYCVKHHENNPAHLELVVVGKNGGLENVVLYISAGPAGRRGQPETFHRSRLRPEGMHVHAARYSDGCRPGIQGDHQRPDRA